MMFKRENRDVNKKSHLMISNVDSVYLAEKYKTPLYVVDEALIRENCRKFKASMKRNYLGESAVCYASKAFSTKWIYRVMSEEGLKADCVSKGEIFTALSADFKGEDIIFHGSNKSTDEIEYAVSNKVDVLVADNFDELKKIDFISKKTGVKQNVYLRLKPGISAHTHEFIKTGQIDSKFGFSIVDNEGLNAVRLTLRLNNIKLKGVHCHIGSQIFEKEPFSLATNVLVDFIEQVERMFRYKIDDIDMGGGFGVRYTQNDSPLSIDDYIKTIAKVLNKRYRDNSKKPKLIVEPGRSIVANAGVTLYRIGAKKEIPNIRTYLSVDGGMADNPRHALYGAKYEAVIANKASDPLSETVTVAGKCCEAGDLISDGVRVAKSEVGDILAVLDTGAYNFSMASNYNMLLKPAVVAVNNGTDKLVVKRQTYNQLIANDI